MPRDVKKPRLFLLDGSALAYRSYFAFIRNPLINSKGVNTGGVFGFTNTVLKILREEKPDYIACVFDTSAPTFRHEKYPEYKATRQKMPDELAEQLPLIRDVVDALNIPLLEMDGFEADDVMGTLAKHAETEGFETFLVTGDKDFMQLVSDRVKMYTLGKGGGGDVEIVGPNEVTEKMGVPPERIVDLLGLMGDSSDNVPGVPGVGPKTAKELLAVFDSMDAILERVEEVEKARLKEKLVEHRDLALLSKDLVTIRTDVPIEAKLEDLKTRDPDAERAFVLFQELEFKRFLPELSALTGEAKSDEIARKYRTVDTLSDLEDLAGLLSRTSMFAMDLETTSLHPMEAEIVGLSFSWKDGEAAYVPVEAPASDRQGDLFAHDAGKAKGLVLETLRPVLENPKIRKCGQNIKYDMLVLRRHGVILEGVDFDSMVAAYLINPSTRQYNLDALSMEYLNLQKIPTKALIGTGKKQISMAEVELERISEYACEDADAAFRLRGVLEPELKKGGMEALFRDVEMPLVHVLMELEENGVALDKGLLKDMSGDMGKQLAALEEDIYELAGTRFNVNSTQQLGQILFEKLKVHEDAGVRPRKTKTGYSTDVRVLESLAVHPLPRKLLDYRQLTKLKSTYVDALPRLIHPETGRVHASFNQTVAATGRLSTSDPNLQNIPIRTELGREIRKAFVAQEKESVLLSADYSQIELRIMAHLSGDETLLESFREGEDVHRRTASEMFDVPRDAVTDDQRRQAKTINFGIMYGMGPFGLASRLGIGREEAEQFIYAYFARYPRVNAFIANTIAQAHEDGFVTTLLNRRRFLPELQSDNRNVREFGERTAVNTPIQGTAADLIKVAMIRISKRLKEKSWRSMMILQIHDELLFEASGDEVERLTDMVKDEMETAIELSVPIKVDVGTGKSWFEAH